MNKKIPKLFYVALVASLLIIVITALFSTSNKIVINNESVTSFNDGWRYFVNGKPCDNPTLTLPATVDANVNDVVLIENTLPVGYPEGMTICFRSTNQYVRVLVDSQEIYRFGYDLSRPYGKSPGPAWNFIRMQKATEGSKLSIELISPYVSSSKRVPQIYYGSKNSNVFYILEQNIAPLLLSMIIILISILLFIVYAFFFKHASSDYLLYLAWFSLLAGGWSLTESRMAQFVVNNQYIVALISFFFFMLLPIPLLLFITETHSLHHKKPLYLICILLLINFVVVTVLQLFGIADFMESLFSTHILVAVGAVAIIGTLLAEIFKYQNKDIYVLGLGTSVFILVSMLDFFQFYGNNAGGNAFFFRFAVLFYILILTYYTVRKLLGMMTQNMRTQMLEQLAFVDLLTDLQNRTSFEKSMEPYRMNSSSCSGLWIGIFDINNLKLVNDTQGHKAGDNLLIAAVGCIKTIFGNRARIYRIGGDEFAILSESLSGPELPALIDSFETEVARVRQERKLQLSIAYGVALFDLSIDKTVDGLYVRADGYMYKKKAEIKEEIAKKMTANI